MSTGKNIVLGVTGSIAAYKAAELASLLTKQGCDVRVVMTADALRFITAVPFKTLSRHPVVTDLYDEVEGWQPTHIKLADEADLLLIAPATANTIAKLAHGPGQRRLELRGAGPEPPRQDPGCPRDERKDVAASGHAAERGHAQVARRGVYRPGGGPALLRLRRAWAGCGRWRKLPNARWSCCGERKPGEAAGLNPGPQMLIMNVGLWQRLRHYSLGELAAAALAVAGPGGRVVETPGARCGEADGPHCHDGAGHHPAHQGGRDRHAPLLVLFQAVLDWGEGTGDAGDHRRGHASIFLWVYIAVNALVAGLLLAMRRVPLLLVQWAVFAMSLVDGIFLSALVVVTGGYDSILYWLFLGLIVRGAVSVPRATSQILLNLTLTVCYVMAGSHQYLHQSRPSKKRHEARAAWQAPLRHCAAPMRPRAESQSQPDERADCRRARGRNRPHGAGRVPPLRRHSLARRPG